MTKKEKHDEALYVRLTHSDVERLVALVSRYEVLTKASLARRAMRIGLDVIERDPTVLLNESTPKRGGARRKG